MSDTPRTDDEQARYGPEHPQAHAAWEFARTLERELIAVKCGFDSTIAQWHLSRIKANAAKDPRMDLD